MAKRYRGKTLRTMPSKGRGTCPICKSTGIKLLYERTLKSANEAEKITVCKRCK